MEHHHPGTKPCLKQRHPARLPLQLPPFYGIAANFSIDADRQAEQAIRHSNGNMRKEEEKTSFRG